MNSVYALYLCSFIFVGIIITSSVYMYCSLQDGDTALIAAASKGHKECIEVLLDNTVLMITVGHRTFSDQL